MRQIKIWILLNYFFLFDFFVIKPVPEKILKKANDFIDARSYDQAIELLNLNLNKKKLVNFEDEAKLLIADCYVNIKNWKLGFENYLEVCKINKKLKNIALSKLDELIISKEVPNIYKQKFFSEFYNQVTKLKSDYVLDLKLELPYINFAKSAEKYKACNPSIIKTSFGYMLICKTVNFITDGKHYDVIGSDIVRTKNYLLKFDTNFSLIDQKEIIDNTNMPHSKRCHALGDCRIFKLNNSYCFICSRRLENEIFKQAICKLGSLKSDKIYINSNVLFRGANPDLHEKNLLPLIIDNDLYLIYSYDPFLILKADLKNGKYKNYVKVRQDFDFSKFRGSAAPLEFDEGYLLMVHELVMINNRREYIHRFLFLDKNLTIKKISLPFVFLSKGIEFCCGMVIDHKQRKLVVPIGINDQKAKICIFDLNYIRSQLRELRR